MAKVVQFAFRSGRLTCVTRQTLSSSSRCKHLYCTSVALPKHSTKLKLSLNFIGPTCILQLHRNYCQSSGVHSDTDNNEYDNLMQSSPLEKDIKELYRHPGTGHNLFLIQPRIKHGPGFESKERAKLKMDEAVALVETLPGWTVVQKFMISVTSTNANRVFGKGNLEMLMAELVNSNHKITGVFIGIDMLTALQNTKLEELFRVQVFDRYQIVLNIFHDHARTKEARLQIALAEIPYLRVKLACFSHTYSHETFQGIGKVGGTGESPMETRRRLLFDRELKIKRALEKLQKKREVLRKSERRNSLPIVAVVGYTNCGKTTLIKSLTNDEKLVPENKLFATLDVTLHSGMLPSSQKVLYIDTVGFISDVPTTLIASFRATLEDLASANIIIHVRDISHPDTEMQKQVVLETLQSLELPEKLLSSIIEVGNKVDLIENIDEAIVDENTLPISAAKGDNLGTLLEKLEEKILENTSHGVQLFRIPNGGKEYSWLYREAAIRDAIADETDPNYLIVETVISSQNLAKFVHYFGDCTISVEELERNQ